MKNKIIAYGGTFLLAAALLMGCGDKEEMKDLQEKERLDEIVETETEIYVFIAKSLHGAMNEIAQIYKENQPNVTISYNADSSGTLQTQIEEGFACDIYFSAAKKQMDRLNDKDFIESNTITNLLGNKLCLITYKGSNTSVTGFTNLENAKDMALADGSVPVGKYTRQLLINMGIIDVLEGTDPAKVTTQEVAKALTGLKINECANVGAVTEAVKEGANEVGTVYYSDAYSVLEHIEILEQADDNLIGESICYPLALVKNEEASEEQIKAARDFYDFLLTDECMEIFKKYMFTEYEND